MLYHLGVVHEIFLVSLAKVCQENEHTEHLKHIDNLVALSILHLEQFVKSFTFVCRIQPKGLFDQLEELSFANQVREVEPLLIHEPD
jgi:hypothetical protein